MGPSKNQAISLSAHETDSLLWHKRLGHANFSLLNKLITKDLVLRLPKSKFNEYRIFDACSRGKHVKSSFKSKNMVSTTQPLELLYMDLCGPMRVQSRGGKRHIFVIVDDYSRFTWNLFLTSKDETFDLFSIFVKKLQRKLNVQVASIRSDHGTEFENVDFLQSLACCTREIVYCR